MSRLKKQAEAEIPTSRGSFNLIAFSEEKSTYAPHLALVRKVEDDVVVNVRLHSECLTGDIFGSGRCDCGEQLSIAMDYIGKHGGIILYLRQEGRGIGLINKLKAYNLQDNGLNTVEANVHLGFEPDQRSYSLAIEILELLEVKKVRLLTNNPEKLEIFKDSSIELIDRIPIEVIPGDENRAYLKDKKDLLGHLLGGS